MAEHEFHMTILGRTIEHLGTQMYKHRNPAVAELVANCWDAGATNVKLTIPDPSDYAPTTSVIRVEDDGEGMDANSIQNCYLVVGRNRRNTDGGVSHNRRVMGRKGIGKLAGFGLADKVIVTTWTAKEEQAIRFTMSLNQLKVTAGTAQDIKFPFSYVDKQTDGAHSGTRIELSQLRHATALDISKLSETLARRFSRSTRGEMSITLNESTIADPTIDSLFSYPEEKDYFTETLPNGKSVKYCYQFARKPLQSKELQGFVIYANERTAQAPPFFFNVESTASAQHSTKYLTGEIVADYLDEGTDDASDLISTDRQELDWEREELTELREWGEKITRELLRKCSEQRGEHVRDWLLDDLDFSTRVARLDPASQREISRFLTTLGQKSEEDDERTRDLAESLIRAYEFRTFHDIIDDIQTVGDDPEKLEEILGKLHDWKVLESRAILEIVKGRLSIVEKLEEMLIEDRPETASSKTHDNLHDLLAEYPWIFNPEWQVFVEEKSIGKQLREWGVRDCSDDMQRKRVDFLAFEKDTDALIIIELKRAGHPVEFDEVQRLERYQFELMRSRNNCRRVLVYGGTVNIPPEKWEKMVAADDFETLTWKDMFSRAKAFYSHYHGVLEGDVSAPGFQNKSIEVSRTRQILKSDSSHRSKDDRSRGLGSPDP